MNDISNKYLIMNPQGWGQHTGGNRNALTAGISYFTYMGKAPKAFKKCAVSFGFTSNAASTVYIDLGICTGPFKFNANTSLRLAGLKDIKDYLKTHGNKAAYVNITLNRTILPKEDVWIGICCDISQAFYGGTTDDIQTGCVQYYNGRFSTALASGPINTIVSPSLVGANVFPPATILHLL